MPVLTPMASSILLVVPIHCALLLAGSAQVAATSTQAGHSQLNCTHKAFAASSASSLCLQTGPAGSSTWHSTQHKATQPHTKAPHASHVRASQDCTACQRANQPTCNFLHAWAAVASPMGAMSMTTFCLLAPEAQATVQRHTTVAQQAWPT